MRIRRYASVIAALGLTLSGCAASHPVAHVTDSAWSPAGDAQFEGVVRLDSGPTTADLTLTVFGQLSGHPPIACAGDLPAGEQSHILDFGVYPQNERARFPAVTVTVANGSGEPMYGVDSVDSLRTSCHPVDGLRLRALAPEEENSELGAVAFSTAQPAQVVVTVDGKTVTVPLRPICQGGETQSVQGCVYDPVHWDDQPGFPEVAISSGS